MGHLPVHPPFSESAPDRAELLRALAWLFGGTVLLLVGQLAYPPLTGMSQLGLAFLLLRVPGWVLPRGHDPEALGCAFAWGPFWPGVRSGLVTLGVVALPFLLGFHLLQREVLGRALDWDLAHLPRWNLGVWASPEDLEYAPETPCGRGEALVWTQPGTLWVLAPADRTLRVTAPAVPTRPVRCSTEGRPRVLAGPSGATMTSDTPSANLETAQVTHTVPAGGGLFLSLGGLDSLDLRLADSDGRPLPAASILLGARGVTASEEGRVSASRDLWWLLAFIAVQLGLVALPEEHFFRGYLQGRLDRRWGTRWRLLGVEVGWGLPASALAFALLHPILIPGVGRLLVFFPALLFGWLRARTSNLGAAVIVHAGCNLLLVAASRMVGQGAAG